MRVEPRHIKSIVLVLIWGLVSIQCGDHKIVGPDLRGTIDENIQALPRPEQDDATPPTPIGNPTTSTHTIGGRQYECGEQEYKMAAEFDEQIALNPTSDILWPGALIDGSTIETGAYVPIMAARNPIVISISLEHISGQKWREVGNPRLSTMREEIADILAQEVTGSTAARMSFEIKDVYSESHLNIALGVSYNDGVNAVRSQFDFSRTDVLTRVLVKFMQVYYTIDIDIPESPSDLFAPSVSWEKLERQLHGVTPVYISSIAYGRMALFAMESSCTKTEVHEALNASLQAIDTNIDLDIQHRSVLQRSTIKATIVGGSGREAVQAVNGFDGLKEYMTKGGDYDQNTAAAPLAYLLRYVCDNSACKIVKATDYVVRTCRELQAGRVGVENRGAYIAKFRVSYKLNEEDVTVNSGKFTAGFSRAMSIPAKATDIVVLTEEDTGFGWKTVFRYTSAAPEVKCWKIWGTTLFPRYGEIGCDF